MGVFERPKKSGIWWARYAGSDGSEHREKVGRKSDAMALYHRRKAEIRSGVKLPANIRAKGITFAFIAEAGLAWSRQHKRDYHSDELRIPHLIADLGHREADSIKPSELDAYITAHAKAPATQNRLKALISMIYREALRNGQVTSNPARLVRMRPVSNGRIRWLTDAEESSLLDHIPSTSPVYRAAILIALHTGMRHGEQFSVEWGQVEMASRQIYLSKTKNGSDRHVPLNSVALAALQSLVPRKTGPMYRSPRTGERLQSLKKIFERAVKDAELQDVTWHTLRHTCISRLVMAGVDLRTVMAIAGHKTMAMTIRYSHLAPAHNLAAVDRLVKVPEQPAPKSAPRKKRH